MTALAFDFERIERRRRRSAPAGAPYAVRGTVPRAPSPLRRRRACGGARRRSTTILGGAWSAPRRRRARPRARSARRRCARAASRRLPASSAAAAATAARRSASRGALARAAFARPPRATVPWRRPSSRGGFGLRGKSGHHRARWSVTPTRGNPRESATEMTPPTSAARRGQARVKWCGKSAPASR